MRCVILKELSARLGCNQSKLALDRNIDIFFGGQYGRQRGALLVLLFLIRLFLEAFAVRMSLILGRL